MRKRKRAGFFPGSKQSWRFSARGVEGKGPMKSTDRNIEAAMVDDEGKGGGKVLLLRRPLLLLTEKVPATAGGGWPCPPPRGGKEF